MLRARAGVNYALTSAMDNGNCGLPQDDLIATAINPKETIEQALKSEISDNNVIVENVNAKLCIFLKGLAVQEQQIAQSLVDISRGKRSWQAVDKDSIKEIEYISQKIGIKLSDSQQQAIK